MVQRYSNDDDEFDVNCEFTVTYEGYEDTSTLKLVEEHNNKCVVIEGKADEPTFKKSSVPIKGS